MLKNHEGKIPDSAALQLQAEQRLRSLLAPLSVDLKLSPAEAGRDAADFLLELNVEGRNWRLACEVKSSGQLRHIRMAALQLKDYVRRFPADAGLYPVVLAPFISPAGGQLCQEMGVGYADLAGNCRLAFGNIYIEKSVAQNPFIERREQRSLFSPKSARVLRLLLSSPGRAWKVAELAHEAGVSLGQTSAVRKMLVDREWVAARHGELRLSHPAALLDAWREAYVPARVTRSRYYTLLHGAELERALKEVLSSVRVVEVLSGGDGPMALLSSFSAARWLAPYARVSGEFLYADEAGEERLRSMLKLESVPRGENVTIDRPKDDGVYMASLETGPGLRCTGLVQTYLDLAAAGERGGEAADYLRQQKIDPLWKAAL